jgi:MOSC N-terminal beta barrel domain
LNDLISHHKNFITKMGNWLLSPEVLLGVIVAVLSMTVFFFERFVPRRIRIKELWFYPIKSCCGVSVQEAVTSRTGLKFDRMFMIVDRNMRFVTQRSFPKLALVHIRMNPNQASLTVHSEGVETSVEISLEPQQQQ